MNEADMLYLLDALDAFRRSHQDGKQHPPDWCMRCMEAIVAESAGFQSREEWSSKLRADPNTRYAADLKDPMIQF